MNKAIPYIIVGLLLLNLVQGWFNGKMPDDYTDTKIELHDLQQNYDLEVKKNQLLEVKLNTVTNEMFKKDTIIGGYTKPQLDSFFTDFLK